MNITDSSSPATVATETMTAKITKRTVKYSVSEDDFGRTLKGPVYVMQDALRKAFGGRLPMKVRIIIEEVT